MIICAEIPHTPTGGSSDLKLANAGLEFVFADGITFQLFGELALHFDHQTIDVTPRLTTLKVTEPPARAAGVKVASVAELIDKLRNEAKVIS